MGIARKLQPRLTVSCITIYKYITFSIIHKTPCKNIKPSRISLYVIPSLKRPYQPARVGAHGSGDGPPWLDCGGVAISSCTKKEV